MNLTSRIKEGFPTVITAAITAVIITPITVYLTYGLNDYLSKDKISIERVDLIPHTTKPLYPSKEIMVLDQNLRFKNYLASRGSTVYQFNPGFYRNPLRQYLNRKDIDEIITVLNDFSKFDEELKIREDAAIQKLENYNRGDNIYGIISSLRHPHVIYAPIVGENDAEVVKSLLELLRNSRNYIESAHQYTSNILNILEGFKPERTGMVEIEIILLNSGDTDGLVKQEGKLYINNRIKDPIYITEKSRRNNEYNLLDIPEQIRSIPKRSMVQKIFTIDVSGTPSGILNTFKNMVIDGDRTPYKVTLDDIRDVPIHSNPFYLSLIQE
jgi:hypothetical protein